MVTKTKNQLNKDLDLDFELDMGDFSFDEINVKDDRKPILKIATAIPKGVLSGLRDSSFIKKIIKDTLPDGYGQTIDLADDIKTNIRKLYDSSASEIKPAIKEFKKVASKLVPSDSKLVPKSVSELFKKWSEQNEYQSKTLSPDQQREAMLSQQMLDIFKVQSNLQNKNNIDQDGKDRLKEGLELNRHRDLFSLANAQAISLSRLEKYQTNVTLQFQKKSLEVQYRTLFAIQDTLTHLRTDSEKKEANLLAIAKNTMLPDFAKLQGLEGMKNVFNNKFAESVSGGLFGNKNQFVQDITKHLSGTISAKLKEFNSGVLEGLSAAVDAKEQAASFAEMGVDMHSVAGEQIGSFGAQSAGSALARKFKDKLTNSKLAKKAGLTQKGIKLETMIANMPGKINSFKNNSSYRYADGSLASLITMLQDALPGSGIDTKANLFKGKDMAAPMSYNRRADKSITEIIPGFLSRILQEVQMMRTGNPNIELTKYDYESNRFTSTSKLAKSIFKEVINKDGVSRTKDELNKLLDLIDPNKQLSEQARVELKKKLLKSSANKEEVNKSNLASSYAYDHLSKGLGTEISGHMDSFMSNMDPATRLEFIKRNNRLSDSVVDKRESIQQNLDLGNMAELKKLGLLDNKGNIQIDQILDYYASGSKSANIKTRAKSTPHKLFTKMNDKVNSGIDKAGKKIKDVEDFIDKKVDKVVDVFVQGKDIAVMTATGIANGEYFNKDTGKVINNISEITGEVKDIYNNTVLSNKDLLSLRIYNTKKLAFEKYELAKTNANSIMDTKKPIILNTYKDATLALTNTYDTVAKYLMDVYVKGEEKPRMTAAKIKAGLYKDADTGQVISAPELISGDVKDEHENIVISKEDIPNLQTYEPISKRFNTLTLIGAGAKWMLGKLWYYQTKIAPKWTMWNLRQLGKVGGFFKNKIVDIIKGVPKDVYVGNEKEPRLYAAKLRAGDYFLVDGGKVIYHHNQISGEVMNADGDILINYNELDDVRVYESAFKWLNPFTLAGKLVRGIGKGLMFYQKNIAPKLTSFALRGLKAIGSGIGSVSKSIISLLTKPIDIYLPGKTKPTLYAKHMEEGQYYSVKTGKPINKPVDIDGAIEDENGKTILTEEEFAQGLFDVSGRPVRKGVLGVIGKNFSKLSKLFSYRRKLLKPSDITKASKESGVSNSEFIGAKSLNVLESIKAIIDKKLNKKSILGDQDGDGIAENSYLDKMKKRKDKTSPTTKDKLTGATAKESDSFLGKLLGTLSGFLGGFGSLGASLIGGMVTSFLGMIPTLAAAMSTAGGLLNKIPGAGLVKGALAMGALAYGVDAVAGKMGVGNKQISEKIDSDNWDKMSWFEKVQSGAARGIEKAGSALFMDNIANQAKSDRIKKESEYINAKETTRVEGVEFQKQIDSTIDALDAVRYKTYGLTVLDEKVKAIRILESLILKQTRFTDKSVAYWEGDVVSILDKVSVYFGVTDKMGGAAGAWLKWFQSRFLPVYMGYLSGAKVFAPRLDTYDVTGSLKPIDKLELANVIIALPNVWNQTTSPWMNYRLASNPIITKENINFLESNSKKTQLIEQKSSNYVPATNKDVSVLINPSVTSIVPQTKRQIQGYAPPDAEVEPSSSNASASGLSTINTGKLTLAAGSLYDGRNAASYLSVPSNVSLSGTNPEMLKLFYGMVEEYGTLTGKKTPLTDGFRTYEQQVAAKKKHGNKAADPGNSLHEYGLALDVDPNTLNDMDKLGLMKKYGFTRPVGQEPWHMEPIGIQENLKRFKQDPNAADAAIVASAGKGGGGYGTMPDANKYGRNKQLSDSILQASVSPTDIDTKLGMNKGITSSTGLPNTQDNLVNPSPKKTNRTNLVNPTYDGETRPRGLMLPSLGGGGYISGINNNRVNNMPADPTVKIPDPTGTGYMGMKDMITASAKMVGVDNGVLMNTIAVESDFNPAAKASVGTASGLAQFTNETWKDTINKYGAKYGYTLANTSVFDPKANAIMAAHYLKDNIKGLPSVNGRSSGATEAYLSHFLGPTGAKTFIEALNSNPNAVAADVMQKAASANPDIFYSNNKPRTISEVYSFIDKKVADKARSYGIELSKPTTSNVVIASTQAAGLRPSTPSTITISSPLDKSYSRTATAAITDNKNLPFSNGFQSNDTRPIAQPISNQLGKEAFAGTESLLTQSLDVQKKMLDTLVNIFGLVSTATRPNNTAAPIKPYAGAEALVPMVRGI